MADDDWDLTAIVRSCSCTTTATVAAEDNPNSNHGEGENPLAGLTFDDEPDPFAFPDLARADIQTGFREQRDCDEKKPFSSGGQRDVVVPKAANFGGQNQMRQLTTVPAVRPRVVSRQPQDYGAGNRDQRQRYMAMATTTTTLGFSISGEVRSMQAQPRPRKKKNNQKRLVVQVTADNLANDVWAWRKYGQKPIKGSPYPRNYYRCSSTKGCGARKQVERSTTDPNMFIISYAGDHTHPKPTHRNSLAGSTRTKFPANKKEPHLPPSPPPPPPHTTPHETTAAACSSPAAAAGLSPTTPLSAAMDRRQTATAQMTARIDDDAAGMHEFESGGDEDANVEEFGHFDDDDDDDDVDGGVLTGCNNNNDNNNNNNININNVGGSGMDDNGADFGDNLSAWIFGGGSSTDGGSGGGG